MNRWCGRDDLVVVEKLERSEMASPSKRRRADDDNGAEDESGLLKLIHRRRGDVEMLMEHIEHLENELLESRAKLDEAETLLDQIRKGSKDTHNERASNKGPKVDGSHGRNGSTSKGSPPLMGSSAKKAGIVLTPSQSKKVALREQPKLPPSGQIHSGRNQDAKYSERPSGGEAKGNKPKPVVEREHVDLISKIRSQSRPKKLDVALPSYIPIQHKRKPRSLVLSPAIDHLCATSALDGVVNFWQITQDKGFGVNLSHTVDCQSSVTRRWPEDLAWHPLGDTLFAVYSADGGPQVGIIRTSKKKAGVEFLKDKPHDKGIINNIQFLPWSNGTQFVTGGCDHAVVLWSEKEEGWKPRLLHKVLHSSSVTGVGGIPHKQLIMSSGMDKRVYAVDPTHGRTVFHHQLESKALGVLPNPGDFNLIMVQTGTPEQQLRLFDIRVQRTELHCFGWKQEASDSQSGYISQSWSPDGLYCASGSTDPKIHIFDIRYNSREPVQTLDAHQKRVFKAAWHPNLPLLLSISSDLFVGMHKIF